MPKRRGIQITLLLGLSIASLGACNAITGVNDLEIVEPKPTKARLFLPPLRAIPGVSVSEIALYQSVKVQLMAGGEPVTPTLPIVEGRDAMLRVFLTTDESYMGVPVTARLILEAEDKPFELTVPEITLPATEGDLKSTVNFKIPGASITADTRYQVVVGEPYGPFPVATPTLTYPSTGLLEALPAQSVGAHLKVKLIPVRYDADSSGRLPDTSEAMLKQYADGFRGMYPIPDIDLSVHAPVPWPAPILADGTGFAEILSEITALRQEENAPPDVYYFALFEPKATYQAFCVKGCVLGLANLAQSPQDNYARAGIGTGYPGRDSVETALHEIGHTHGRQHSPSCEATGPDPQFPYKDGKDGVWGYDALRNLMFSPAVNYDVMGYCTPYWISDYTYVKLFERVRAVNTAQLRVPSELRDLTYERVLIDPRGAVKWLSPLKMALPPVGEERTVLIESSPIAEARTGQFYPFDHLDGGVLFWPSTGRRIDAIRFEHAGQSLRVPR